MTNSHYAAVFDYKAYIQEIEPYVDEVDHQNYARIREFTCRIIQKFEREWPLVDHGLAKYEKGLEKKVLTQEWPLYEHGGDNLLKCSDITDVMIPSARDIGDWFLILLANYLQPCPSPRGNWYVLNTVLSILGWQAEDCELLFKGVPTSKLLKPHNGNKSPWPLTNKDPYWLWLHPSIARSGWLPFETICKFQDALIKLSNNIETFEIQLIPKIDIHNPTVIKEYKNYLLSSYYNTLKMLSTAVEQERGLFMSIMIYT